MKKIIPLIFVLFPISINLFAQKNDNAKNSKAQITFGYPIGSNGADSRDYTNNFSLNILYGLNGGVNGVEIGSILNQNDGDVVGTQISGVVNLNTGYSDGVLLSGVSNICNGFTRGLFISGVSNICRDTSSGVFVSGVLNYSEQNSKGFQLATINISMNELNGFQLGVVNFSKKIKGVQLGVVNILNEKDGGIPVGVVSVVKNGLYEFELTGGDAIYSNLNYKMGIDKLYTIYKIGYSTFHNKPVYSYGMGFGTTTSLSEKQHISIDATSNNIIYNNKWNQKLNLLNKVDCNYKYSITPKLTLLIGPSFNVYVTKVKVDDEYGTLNIPYTFYTNNWTKGKLSMWIGFNAGLSLKL